MARTKNAAPDQPQTTAQQIGSLIKSARDIMRKDKGLSTDIDRLPLLTWIMFLKFLDDMEQIEESKAKMRGERHRPAIEPPYRWRDWAAREDGITGPELLAFISQEETTLPNGKRGPGLLTALRALTGGNGAARRRRVIATVFKDINCRMISGYLLRDVINKVNGIHFLAKEEVFTLGHFYETMLREMRDAAGQNGEFYTPRPVVKFMVEAVDPRLGETVLDPACGTGGFLVETYQHLERQCKTVAHRRTLQDESILGGEAKPLPYLLCQMNLLLHGMEAPDIDPENSLRFKLTEMADKDRVDVILTNPPFGGEEEAGIKGNFPADMQTSETALLFLQLIMRKLRRAGSGSIPGRCGMIVPDGVLAGDGVCARIKEQLLREFDLHTIVRLPQGAFAPYTGVPANLLFFERTGPTKTIWFYDHPLPEGRKSYTKTQPLRFEELEPCLTWWKNRQENEHVWRVSAEEIAKNGFNLDIKNPRVLAEDYSIPLSALTGTLAQEVAGFSTSAADYLLAGTWAQLPSVGAAGWEKIRLGNALQRIEASETVQPEQSYRLLGVQLDGKGPFLRETKLGQEIRGTKLNRVTAGSFIYSRLFAWRGAFGVVPLEFNGCYVSNEFPIYKIDEKKLLPEFLRLYFGRPTVLREVEKNCRGTTKASRNRFKEEYLLNMVVSAPSISVQQQILALARASFSLAAKASGLHADLSSLPLKLLAAIYRGTL